MKDAERIASITTRTWAQVKPRARWYEIARKHVGRQPEWKVSLLLLAKKCGTMQRNLRRFKFDLKELAERDRLPDYRMFLVNDHSSATAKAMEAGGMKDTKGAKRTPNEAVIVLFKPRARALPCPEIVVTSDPLPCYASPPSPTRISANCSGTKWAVIK